LYWFERGARAGYGPAAGGLAQAYLNGIEPGVDSALDPESADKDFVGIGTGHDLDSDSPFDDEWPMESGTYAGDLNDGAAVPDEHVGGDGAARDQAGAVHGDHGAGNREHRTGTGNVEQAVMDNERQGRGSVVGGLGGIGDGTGPPGSPPGAVGARRREDGDTDDARAGNRDGRSDRSRRRSSRAGDKPSFASDARSRSMRRSRFRLRKNETRALELLEVTCDAGGSYGCFHLYHMQTKGWSLPAEDLPDMIAHGASRLRKRVKEMGSPALVGLLGRVERESRGMGSPGAVDHALLTHPRLMYLQSEPRISIDGGRQGMWVAPKRGMARLAEAAARGHRQARLELGRMLHSQRRGAREQWAFDATGWMQG